MPMGSKFALAHGGAIEGVVSEHGQRRGSVCLPREVGKARGWFRGIDLAAQQISMIKS